MILTAILENFRFLSSMNEKTSERRVQSIESIQLIQSFPKYSLRLGSTRRKIQNVTNFPFIGVRSH